MINDFSETATTVGGGTYAANGHSSKSKLLYGPYVGAMLRYDFTKCWGVFVGAQFQSLTDLKQSVVVAAPDSIPVPRFMQPRV
ncbi:MAG: hypothetical protein WDM76_07055 [Limisphaerales bacterium]